MNTFVDHDDVSRVQIGLLFNSKIIPRALDASIGISDIHYTMTRTIHHFGYQENLY